MIVSMPDYFGAHAIYQEDTIELRGCDEIVAWLRRSVADDGAVVRQKYRGLRVVLINAQSARRSSVRVSIRVGRTPKYADSTSTTVSDVEDVYRLDTDGRWRIARRTTTRVIP
jgi:hypothetical protein